MNSKVIGNIGEAITIAEFVRRGIPVYTSFGENERAEFNGKLNKIQCKTSESINVPIPYRKTNQNTPLNYEDYLYDTVLDNIRFDS